MNKLNVILQGGLGNQLFTYFAAADYAQKHNKMLVLHLHELSFGFTKREFELSNYILPVPYKIKNYNKKASKLIFYILNFLFKLLSVLAKPWVFESKKTGFDEAFFKNRRIRLVKGYFQTYIHYEEVLRIYPKFKIDLINPSPRYLNLLKEILTKEPILVHVRLGDYIGLKQIHGLLSESYYLNLLKIVNPDKRNEVWIITQNIEEFSKSYPNLVYHKILSEDRLLTDSEVLMLMAHAVKLITANSSFSWWAGMLGNQDKIIYCPKEWLFSKSNPDFHLPKTWHTCESIWT